MPLIKVPGSDPDETISVIAVKSVRSCTGCVFETEPLSFCTERGFVGDDGEKPGVGCYGHVYIEDTPKNRLKVVLEALE